LSPIACMGVLLYRSAKPLGRIDMLRIIFGGLLMLSVAACNGAADLQDAPEPLGDFRLGHNIVVAPKVVKGPLSRNATEEELTTALQTAIAERFDRYEGEKLYHFGVSVEGYVLAAPGIPLVLAPKSIMIVNITVWDNAANAKMNTKAHQITVLESLDQGPLLGSGYTKSAEEQLKNLSQNAAKSIERYLTNQKAEKGWFTGE
jgi:hypothetical protein